MAQIAKESRRAMTWTKDEDALLLKMVEKEMGREDIAVALRRTVPAIRNRLCLLRRNFKPYPIYSEKRAEVIPVVEKKKDDELELMMWFVKEAWLEGHAIIVPALGATFQKGNGNETNN